MGNDENHWQLLKHRSNACSPDNRYRTLTALRRASSQIQSQSEKVEFFPFDQQNAVAGRSEFAGSSACALIQVHLALRFLAGGFAAFPIGHTAWKRFLCECVKEFDACRDDRAGSCPQPLLLKMARQQCVQIFTSELPKPQVDPQSGEFRLVPIAGQWHLTEALEQVNAEFAEPFAILLTSPKLTSGANTYGLYIGHYCMECYDTHPKYRDEVRDGMCKVSFPAHRFDLVARWVCSSLAPHMACQTTFEIVAAGLKRNHNLPANGTDTPSASSGTAPAAVLPSAVLPPVCLAPQTPIGLTRTCPAPQTVALSIPPSSSALARTFQSFAITSLLKTVQGLASEQEGVMLGAEAFATWQRAICGWSRKWQPIVFILATVPRSKVGHMLGT